MRKPKNERIYIKERDGKGAITPITCFVSIPFAEKFDRIWAKGVLDCSKKVPGYDINFIRLDREPFSRRIIEYNVLDHIEVSDLLLADISPDDKTNISNPSVMHEIGYATGKNIPIILIGAHGTHNNLPANLRGSLLVEYDLDNIEKFTIELIDQLSEIINKQIMLQPRGDYTVQCFTERDSIGIPALIERAIYRVQIITTNLEYIDTNLKVAIHKALECNKNNPQFKVEILTMDPEGDTTSARAAQLGRKARQYRDELRQSLDTMREAFAQQPKVEIVTYTSLPTQITFIIDNILITSVISFGQQSRANLHFVLEDNRKRASESFIAHFRAMKALAVSRSIPG